ncbi:MAG: hypothetical protein SCK29_12080 [Bacillota bacterium]|nr:hypothetical protein [Bacillota bacterium]MDW7684843.1 hypothetical protein [Bacillota bacterium]
MSIELVGCVISGTSVEDVAVRQRVGDQARVVVVVQVMFVLEVLMNGVLMTYSFSFFFFKQCILIIPERVKPEFDVLVRADCTEAFFIDEEHVEVTVAVETIISVINRVDLLIPAFGFCPEPRDCDKLQCPDVFTLQFRLDDTGKPVIIEPENSVASLSSDFPVQILQEVHPPTEVVEIHTDVVFDSRRHATQQTGIVRIPIDPPPPHDFPPRCLLPMARTRGFWGTGRGGIRRLIDTGQISKTAFVEKLVIPIAGPGGLSPFINTFFGPALFVGPDIDGIYDRYVELFTTPIAAGLIFQLAIQLFATYLNVLATETEFLPPDQVCVEGTTFAVAAILNIDLPTCDFTVTFDDISVINGLFADAEDILSACCPGEGFPCNLTNPQLSSLIAIFDMINNSQNIFDLHTLD